MRATNPHGSPPAAAPSMLRFPGTNPTIRMAAAAALPGGSRGTYHSLPCLDESIERNDNPHGWRGSSMSPRPLRGGAEAGGVSSNTVYVRGVGGVLEDVEALKALFARYGTVLRAKVRHRIDATSGLNTSWALVQMWTPSEAECVLRQKFESPEGRTLEVTRFDQEQADRSVGGMRWTAQQLPDYSFRRIDVRCDVTAMAQRVFTELDTDTDGYLTSSQVQVATRKLQLVELRGHGSRHKWYWQMLDMEKALCLRKQTPSSVAAAVSEDGTATERQDVKQNHVSRETFVCWVKLYHDKLKQLTVAAAEKLFALLDQNDDGTLDRYEVEKLTASLQRKFRWLTFDPPFDSERDYQRMYKLSSNFCDDSHLAHHPGQKACLKQEGVTFNAFRTWWKARLRVDEPSVAILPEFMVHTIHEEHERRLRQQGRAGGLERHGRKGRDGRSLWNFLRSRLKLMVRFQAAWGQLHEMYANEEAISQRYDPIAALIPPYICHPESMFAFYWDLAVLVIILGISFHVPLQVCFGLAPLRLLSVAWIWEMFTNIFFATDFILNLRTAYYDESGLLVYRPGAIARHYMRTWAAVDALSTFPSLVCDCMELFAGAKGSTVAAEFQGVKVLRMLRLSKMIRLAKLKAYLTEEGVKGTAIITYMQTGFTLVGTFYAAHLLACFWHMVRQCTAASYQKHASRWVLDPW
jgi:hypothetical protein